LLWCITRTFAECAPHADGHKLTVQFDKPGERKILARFVNACEPSRPQAKQVAQRASGMAAIDNNAAVLFPRLR
jgi:hypothetical protein